MGQVYHRVMALSVVMLLSGAAVHAHPDRAARLDTRVDVTATAADIGGVLSWLAKKGRINIVTTPKVRGAVTLHLKRVTVANALRAVVATGGWSMERSGNVIVVMTRGEELQRIDDARRRR